MTTNAIIAHTLAYDSSGGSASAAQHAHERVEARPGLKPEAHVLA